MQLAESDLLERSRVTEAELALQHARARIGLDVAEFWQERELRECSLLDASRRRIEGAERRSL